ncbi:hypothetical protein [Youxingia wuxianensis]|uniref:Gram-positive cocci surface proteins LPxTG domain-containing protein n=1 Tax=Youxingia wuxianensis TaxID=2763678 RepID=A0A926IBY2_9FIRM|nr:hypothetical protein [Youxingia wuxianensis]MBC8584607.1 hypothetical protein [Youxingia wuxianensis]
MKKVLSLVLAAAMVLSLGVVSFAADLGKDIEVEPTASLVWYDEDGNAITPATANAGGTVMVNDVYFGDTIYIELADLDTDADIKGVTFADSDDFTLSTSKSTNGAIVKSVQRLEGKKFDAGTDLAGRTDVIEIKLNDSTTTDEKKVEFSLVFKAKEAGALNGGDNYPKSAKFTFDIKLYVTNREEDADATIEAGDKVVINPVSNDKNEIIWTNASGDDIAKLAFEANDDADSFYAKLSTKYNTAIATKYGDPVGAEMYFWTFTGSATIDSTARATLTLYNPFDEEDDVDFANGYWYTVDADGVVSEVKNLTYVDTDEDGNDVDGFRVKTRTLGNYIFSDVELDLEEVNADAEDDGTTDADGKPIPNTGSSDMVNVAVVAAVVSLAAAGAVAFKKASK